MPHLRSTAETIHNMFDEMPKTRGVADCALVDDGAAGSVSICGTAVVKSIPYVDALHGKNGDGSPPNGSDFCLHKPTLGPIGTPLDIGKIDQGNGAAALNIISSSKQPCSLKEGTTSYANVLEGDSSTTNNVSPMSELPFHAPMRVNGRIKVCPPAAISKEGCEYWSSTLVGFFLDKKLPFPVVNSIANKIWVNLVCVRYIPMTKGCFYLNLILWSMLVMF